MKINLLPEKHVRTYESIIGLGAIVLASLKRKPKNLDGLWADVKDNDTLRHRIHGVVTLDKIILAIDFLFAIGVVRMTDKGILEHASH